VFVSDFEVRDCFRNATSFSMAMIAIDGGAGGNGDNQTYKLYCHLKTLTVHENVVSCVKFSNNRTLLASTKP